MYKLQSAKYKNLHRPSSHLNDCHCSRFPVMNYVFFIGPPPALYVISNKEGKSCGKSLNCKERRSSWNIGSPLSERIIFVGIVRACKKVDPIFAKSYLYKEGQNSLNTFYRCDLTYRVTGIYVIVSFTLSALFFTSSGLYVQIIFRPKLFRHGTKTFGKYILEKIFL